MLVMVGEEVCNEKDLAILVILLRKIGCSEAGRVNQPVNPVIH
jgi:hypothetical protein